MISKTGNVIRIYLLLDKAWFAVILNFYPNCYLSQQVIRDKRSNKTKGYGFVSFKDPGDFANAMRDYNGESMGLSESVKYVM